jgi:hypothetical protein
MLIGSLLVVGLVMPMMAHYPVPGSEYHTDFYIPMLGRQHIEFRISSRSDAELHLHGPVVRRDSVQYRIAENGEVAFVLGDSLHAFMNKYRSEIAHARYDGTADIAVLLLKIRPIRFTKEIILRRKNVAASCS